jgi:hypothetical protein
VQIIQVIKFRKIKEDPIDWQLAWLIFFILQSVFSSITIFGDYYQGVFHPDYIDRLYINKFGQAIGLLGLVALLIPIEKILDSKFINSAVLSIISLCVIIFYNFPSNYLTIFVFVANSATLIMIFTVVSSRLRDYPNLSNILRIFVSGYILLSFGNLLKSDLIIGLFYTIPGMNILIVRLVADIIVIVSIFFLSNSFSSFPAILELNWRNHVLEIHVLSGKGIEIFHKSFSSDKVLREIEPDLVGMAMTGVSDIIREVTGSKKNLNLIDQTDFKILFEKDENFILFLVTKEPLKIYEYKLDNLLGDLNKNYGSLVPEWKGDTKQFSGVEDIIDNHFM